MSDKIATLATFGSVGEAHLAKNLLESEGVKCFLADEASVDTLWYVGSALGGVKLMVPQDQVERAERILDHEDAPPETSAQATEQPPQAETETRITSDKPDGEFFPAPDEAAGEAERGDDAELEVSPGEVMATRAFRSSIFGIAFVPFTLYSLWILFNVFRWDGELTDSGRRKVFWSSLINGLVLLVFLLVSQALYVGDWRSYRSMLPRHLGQPEPPPIKPVPKPKQPIPLNFIPGGWPRGPAGRTR
jgi:hypothetical protein